MKIFGCGDLRRTCKTEKMRRGISTVSFFIYNVCERRAMQYGVT